MKNKALFLLLLGWALLAPLQARPAQPDSIIIYSNSFEIPEDTAGWVGLFSYMLVDNPAPDQGSHALLIGGGCIQPTAWINIPCVTGDGRYRLSLWGTVSDSTYSGGDVLLSRADWMPPGDQVVEIEISALEWTRYSAETDIPLEENDTLRIQIQVGGYFYDEMLLDGLEVVRVGELGHSGDAHLPTDFYLAPLVPNPFNPAVTIRWSQPRSAEINIIVFDVTGRPVSQPVAQPFLPGSWSLTWQPEGLPSGLYLFRLSTLGFHQVQKAVFLK